VESISLTKFKRLMSNEVALLSSVDHPSVIKLVEFNLTGELVVKPSGKCIQIFFIVLELVEKGDLFSLMESGAFSERVARFFFK
jgi:serine/threonine protein kinase